MYLNVDFVVNSMYSLQNSELFYKGCKEVNALVFITKLR